MCVLGATVGVLLFSLSLFSQGNFGRILGLVTDQSGGVISGATVTIIDKDRGVARTLTTDAAGEYSAPTLIPGNYTVRVDANGFKRVDRQNVVLEVGKEVRVDVTVQPGEQTQTITVTEAIPLVETTNATLGGALSNADINDMPLNGRNYQNLISLRPGIMIQPGGSPWSQSTNNVRPDETAWMLDGVISVSFYDARPVGNSPSAFTDAATIVPIDAIQEFNTQENPKAEYGWKPGAVVNVGIRSGTNTLHGSAYAFGRDVNWDARNVFNAGPVNGTCIQNPAVPTVCDKLPTELEQFGATAGGPIKKDKLFFFAGYEGLRSHIGNIFVIQGPETASQVSNPLINSCPGSMVGDCQNSMVDAIQALQNQGVARSLISEELLGCTEPTTATASCTGGLYANAGANTTNYPSTFPNTNRSDNGIGKMDYTISSKHRISGMLWTGAYIATGQDHPIVNALFSSGIQIRSWSTVESWIWTPSSTVVNEFRFGYNRVSQGFTIGDSGIIPDGTGGLCTASGCGGKGYPLNTGVTKGGGLPFIQIAGFTGGGGGGLGNPNGSRPGLTGPSPYSDFQDSVSYLRGKHALKFGVEFAHLQADQLTQQFRGNPIKFNGGLTPGVANLACGGSCPLEDFFAGNPTFGINNVGDGVRKMIWNKYAGFVQDDWRIKPRLMLNLGLRYEYDSPIREVNNLFANFDPNSEVGIVQQGQPGVGNSLWKPNRKNFSPRVGFAWDITGKGTTVVRAASSVIFMTIYARPFMDNGPPNGSLGNIAQDPTGATFVSATPLTGFTACVPATVPATYCHAATGTINLGQPTFVPPDLKWNGVVFPQSGLSCTPTSQCSLMALDPNLKTPFVVNYNLNVQHTFGSNLSLEVGYVGNHGANLLALYDKNQCAPNPNGNCARQYTAKFPYLQYINFVDNFARSNYSSLQATLTKRASHGLDFTVGYTYGHGLDDGSLNFNGLPPQDSLNRGAEYASSDFDVRHRLTVTASYAIPGKKGFGQLLEGWKLNTIVSLQTPQPWLVFDTGDDFSTGHSGFGDLADRWNITGNPADFKSGSTSIPFCSGFAIITPDTITAKIDTTGATCSQTSGIYGTTSTPANSAAFITNCVANTAGTLSTTPGGLTTNNLPRAGCFASGNSVVTPPAMGTYGNMGRNIFRDSGFKNVDFSVFKDFKFRERFGAEFRVEFFNLFNHPIIANPFGSSNTSFLGPDPSNPGKFGCGCSTPDVAAGNPLIGSGSSRVMQLGLKLSF
jgi:hypothetical protein